MHINIYGFTQCAPPYFVPHTLRPTLCALYFAPPFRKIAAFLVWRKVECAKFRGAKSWGAKS